MSHDNQCDYCERYYRSEEGDHECEVVDLKRVIDDLRDAAGIAGKMLAGEDA